MGDEKRREDGREMTKEEQKGGAKKRRRGFVPECQKEAGCSTFFSDVNRRLDAKR